MLRKLLVTTAVLLVASVGVASAQQGSLLPTASLVAVPAQGAPGGTSRCDATGYRPGTEVQCDMLSDPVFLGKATANANGTVSIPFKVPNLPAGEHQVRATGTGADGRPLVQFTRFVIPSTSGGGNNLPKTGADSTTPIAQIGAGAIAAGGLLLLVAKKRRSSVKTTA